MNVKLNILGINGSASQNSSNQAILRFLAEIKKDEWEIDILEDLSVLPHFRTELTDENTPEEIINFRNRIAHVDGIIICTPEYVFSIPSGLKNAIEWCVSTTVLSDKPVGLITASASGEKGHEELKLIMKTVQTTFTDKTTLLIQGVRGKMDREGEITDNKTESELKNFVNSFKGLIEKSASEH